MVNTKKMAILFVRKRMNASNPRAETRLFFSVVFMGGQSGMVKAYNPRKRPEAALTYSCIGLAVQPAKSTDHMAAIKPTVPHTRMGGNIFMMSKPLFSSTI